MDLILAAALAAGRGRAAEDASFRDLFSQFFRGQSAAQQGVEEEPGTDLEYQIDITFAEAMRGTVKKLSFTRLDVCNVCHGSGVEPGEAKVCPTCGGTGHVTQSERQDAISGELLALWRLRAVAYDL